LVCEAFSIFKRVENTVIFLDMGDFQKALEWITQSLHLRESVDYTLGIAYCYATMGELYGEMGDFNTALEYFEKILRMYRRGDSDLEICASSTEYLRSKVGEINQ
jgi:tetratricopeptide (TPR) repeat protein